MEETDVEAHRHRMLHGSGARKKRMPVEATTADACQPCSVHSSSAYKKLTPVQAANFKARQLRELHRSSVCEKCKLADQLSARHGSGAHEKGKLIVAAN